ncbi:MAG: phage head closure protein [Oscillospiraceae bacterium]|nr:phage head closure protein [Oscillospiraceae bacterium]
MKIELLNVMIEIQKNSTVTDRYANHRSEWIPYYTCYATASAESPKESSEAGLIVDGSKIDFTIRHCKKAAAISGKEYRILFQGQTYNILGVDHMNFKRKSLKFHCQREDR